MSHNVLKHGKNGGPFMPGAIADQSTVSFAKKADVMKLSAMEASDAVTAFYHNALADNVINDAVQSDSGDE